ncbi:MAG TPA: cytochrome C oxidase subunit IV family protein [Pirellulales bacterium]|jgi:cytochrome c oxidase subunit 4|nr:cytochrome C oxidase subunit IV family protein [Pirellulales bacterium]
MSHAATHHEHASHDDHGGIAKYIVVFVALCVLTTMSFFTYSSYWPWHGTPAVARLFMTAVSCIKAMLVILFFMHVKYEANWKYVLTIPASIMSVFLCLALVPDVGARMNGLFGYHGRYSEERREHIGREHDNQVMHSASLQVGHHEASHESGQHSEPAAVTEPAAVSEGEKEPAAAAEEEK